MKQTEDNMAKVEVAFAKSSTDFDTTFIETGNIGLDMAVSNGRGLPSNGCVLLHSEPGAGKSTICADAIRRILTRCHKENIPFKVIYIDVEGSTEMLKKMGLAKFVDEEYGNRLLYKCGYTNFSELEAISNGIMSGDETYKDVKLIVIDSITMITSKQEEEAELEKGDFGTANRVRYAWYKRQVALLKSLGVSLLLISQERVKQNAGPVNPYAEKNKSASGMGDEHYADVILKLTKSESAQRKGINKEKIKASTSEDLIEMTPVFITKFKAGKNRYSRVGEIEILVAFGKGVLNKYILTIMLERYGLLKSAKGSRKGSHWVSEELLAFVGAEYKNEGTDEEFHRWIVENISKITEYLKINDLYRSLPDDAFSSVTVDE
jgi:RecA/RadA recombinase